MICDSVDDIFFSLHCSSSQNLAKCLYKCLRIVRWSRSIIGALERTQMTDFFHRALGLSWFRVPSSEVQDSRPRELPEYEKSLHSLLDVGIHKRNGWLATTWEIMWSVIVPG